MGKLFCKKCNRTFTTGKFCTKCGTALQNLVQAFTEGFSSLEQAPAPQRPDPNALAPEVHDPYLEEQKRLRDEYKTKTEIEVDAKVRLERKREEKSRLEKEAKEQEEFRLKMEALQLEEERMKRERELELEREAEEERQREIKRKEEEEARRLKMEEEERLKKEREEQRRLDEQRRVEEQRKRMQDQSVSKPVFPQKPGLQRAQSEVTVRSPGATPRGSQQTPVPDASSSSSSSSSESDQVNKGAFGANLKSNSTLAKSSGSVASSGSTDNNLVKSSSVESSSSSSQSTDFRAQLKPRSAVDPKNASQGSMGASTGDSKGGSVGFSRPSQSSSDSGQVDFRSNLKTKGGAAGTAAGGNNLAKFDAEFDSMITFLTTDNSTFIPTPVPLVTKNAGMDVSKLDFSNIGAVKKNPLPPPSSSGPPPPPGPPGMGPPPPPGPGKGLPPAKPKVNAKAEMMNAIGGGGIKLRKAVTVDKSKPVMTAEIEEDKEEKKK